MAQPQFQYVRNLGEGTFGVCKLVRDLSDGEEVAIKFLPRGPRINKNVEREVYIHSQISHPNVIGFKKVDTFTETDKCGRCSAVYVLQVFLTEDSLGLCLEYANGGELFERVKAAGRFEEDMARFFFQQLLSGVQFLHENGVAHRDLKLENTLLKLEVSEPGRSPTPVLKIADFGFCKHEKLHTPPKSRVGTPAYISPEVLEAPQVYDGKAADVWSCAVHLYIMLVGWYPFTDPREPKNFSRTACNIKRARYAFPSGLQISDDCKELIRLMFVRNPAKRITIPEIKEHRWYRKNLSREMANNGQGLPCYPGCRQTQAEIRQILAEAQKPYQRSQLQEHRLP